MTFTDIETLNIPRYWSRVDSSKGPDACWPWKGGYSGEKPLIYGKVMIKRRYRKAHRVAYVLTYGALDDALLGMHQCNNTLCCNPMHITAGTHADNMAYCKQSGRSTYGVKNKQARLTEDQVKFIRSSPDSSLTLSQNFGVNPSTVSLVRTRKRWKYL